MVVLADLAPCLVTVYYRVFLQRHFLQYLDKLVKILLAFLQPVTERIGRHLHTQVGKPTMKKAESNIFHIDLVCYGLKKLRSDLGAVKLCNDLWITDYREITPLGFLALLDIVNQLETFFDDAYIKMEHRDHLFLKYTSRDFGQVRLIFLGRSLNSHGFIGVRTIRQITWLLLLRSYCGWRLCFFIGYRVIRQRRRRTIKILLVLGTIRLCVRTLFLGAAHFVTKAILVGKLQLRLQVIHLPFGDLTLLHFGSQAILQILHF